MLAANASAANFTVINLNDSGAGSLRQAIIDANNLAGDDTISFQNDLSGTITLTSAELPVSSNIIINGLTANLLTVERSSVAGTPEFRIFNIAAVANVTISNLKITGGRLSVSSSSFVSGGGISNAGTLNLTDAIITGNSINQVNGSIGATDSGGGIYNTGTLSLTNSVVSSNIITGAGSGGGGITNTNTGNLTLSNTQITGNQANANTSGLQNSGCGCGGGIDNAGTAVFTNVDISGNYARGRWAWGGGVNNTGSLTISKTTINNNTSSGSTNREAHGGGIRSSGTLNLINSTISLNIAALGTESRGGGLYVSSGSASLKSATIAANTVSGTISVRQGGGIYSAVNSLSLYNTIVAENSAVPSNGPPTTGFDISGAITSQGNNLISNTTGNSGWISSDIVNQPALLAPLGDYGGQTPTIALLPDSPAINAGNNANAEATDQRGAPRIIGGTIDIGAFENNVQISPVALPDGAFGVPYNQTLSATRLNSLPEESIFISNQDSFNQLPPFSFSVVSGSLPNGLTLSQSGSITGTPATGGTFSFTVKASDSDAMAGVRAYNINIPCSYSLSSNGQPISAAGGTGSFTVNAAPGCAWTAESNDSWISITGGASGNGSGTVQFSVQPNNGAERVGTITAAGQTFTITQASGCAYSLSSSGTNIPASGGSGSFNVTAATGCTWTAATGAPWINITSGSGNGNGTVSFTVQANTAAARTGTITVGGQTFTVNQAPSCSYSLSSAGTSFPAPGGSGSFNVTAFNGCQWTAMTITPWLIINSGSGNGNGSVTYTVQPNAQPARKGTITVDNQTFTINQASGCSFTLSAPSANVPDSSSTGGFTVNSGAGCMWTASSNDSWINITSGNSGSGSGDVTFSVQMNTGQARTGTITAGGQTFTINQAGHISRIFDFDGDGKTDISIYRPSAGEWWYLRSIDGGNYAAQFGSSTDKLAPGDYTGDGKTDIAIFRPATGEWFILRSEDGTYYSFPFGTLGDIPAPGDFDADGKTDQAVFRPSDTTWYIRRSSDSGFTIQQFGASNDVPAVADYDGDGKSDIAIYRPSLGQWWLNRSSAGVIVFTFGNNTDKLVQGDYTGDGKADVAIWRPSSGEWFILRSENQSYYSFPFGANGDVPAPGDYDGDGKFDATVFRPSQSTWYIQRSTAGTLIQSFGTSGDIPVPNAFIP
ncbi:MAG: BACON domain-containing carbohydrate-binding protein [Pyrinomonadaceae bacterium]